MSEGTGDELKFSQESLSLLLTGGATGVPLESHIPLSTGLYSPDPNIDNRLPLVTPVTSLSTMSTYTSTPGPYIPSSSYQAGSGPAVEKELRTDDMPGSYDFTLKFEEKKEYPKNFPHCYSREKDTLIVKDQTAIPFTFISNYSMRNLRIRITACYTSKDSFNIPVVPCNNHAGSSQGVAKEFVSCDNRSALDVKEDGRHSVLLPLIHCRDVSGNGTELVENLLFNCRSSCSMKSSTGSKGINNRPLSLIFQLETNEGVPVGRRVISLKVAVSPGRDIATLIKQESGAKRARKRSRTDTASSSSAGKTSPKEKKKPKSVATSHKYTVVVNGMELRNQLQAIANSTDAKYDGTSDSANEWAEYLGGEPYSQTSVGTQENASQPDEYSLEGWLTRYGLECYSPQLVEAGFGLPSRFQCIQESDLDQLEIFDKCHRLTLLHAAKRILIRGVANIVKGEC